MTDNNIVFFPEISNKRVKCIGLLFKRNKNNRNLEEIRIDFCLENNTYVYWMKLINI